MPMLVHISNDDEIEAACRGGLGARMLSAIHFRTMRGFPACLPAGTYKSRVFRERFYGKD